MDSNNRFEYAAQATSDAIWDRNYSENVINWSEGFRTLFGYDINAETTAIGFWRSKIHPDDVSRVSKIIQEAKDDPAATTWSAEYRFQKANGDYAFVKEKAIILRDDNGKAARTVGALQDVTEIRQNEIALKALNEMLEKEKYFLDSLMDNMPDSIYFKDRDSKVIRVSKYMARRFAATVDDLIGKTDFDFQGELHAREAFADEQKIMETGIPKIDYLEKEVTKDGTEYWVSTTKMPMTNAQGEIVGTFGISRDVTTVRNLERERHQALVDKAVAQGKFEIASDVMHDIGNAVVGFGTYLTRIRRLQAEDNPDTLKNLGLFFEKQKDALVPALGEAKTNALVKMFDSMSKTQRANQEEINRSIIEQQNIIASIQEILNIQRQYISGRDSGERKPVNLEHIVDDSLSMLSAVLEDAGITMHVNVASALPVIRGDRTKLMQALLNILRNSIEAIDAGKPDKSIHLSAFTSNGKVVLQVKDNGSGFNNGAHQLFSKGFTTKPSGSGLGLYSCQRIVESHEGTIDIYSPGQGKGAVATMEFKIEL
ncbi:MAG TPA: PAS domain S-box protein [Chitinophagaceae bacterium]|nr:PAS domain S-box protein [Chitinophagaceae bacterium]